MKVLAEKKNPNCKVSILIYFDGRRTRYNIIAAASNQISAREVYYWVGQKSL